MDPSPKIARLNRPSPPPISHLPTLSQPLTATQLRAAILGGLASSSRSHISRTAAASATSPALVTPARDSLQEVLADYVLVEEQPAAGSLAARKIGGAGAGLGKRRDWLEGLI